MAPTPSQLPWWHPPLRSPTHGRSAGAHEDVEAERARLSDCTARLRRALREERHRLRPDAWETLRLCVHQVEELLPVWEAHANRRPAETAELAALLTLRVEPAVTDFLALPDSRKPQAADALAAALAEDRAQVERLHRRLSAALEARLRGRSEVR